MYSLKQKSLKIVIWKKRENRTEPKPTRLWSNCLLAVDRQIGPSNQSIQQTVATNPPHLDVSPGFSSTERAIPAVLLRCLLLRAGIEENPGPPKIWICPGCHQRINKTQYSARCRTYYNWHHLNNCLTNINGHYYCNNCPHPSSNSRCLLASAGASQRPTSTSSFNSSARNKPSTSQAVSAGKLNFLQLNCNGIKNKQEEIQQHLINHNIHIAALQESKLTKGSKNPVFREYAIYRKDRGIGRGGGLILLIHNSIPYSIKSLPDVPTIESQAITINASDTDINIINIYIPPQSTCPTGFTASISKFLLIPNVVLLGDVNAHDPLWYSSLEDTRGEALASEIENSGCSTLNLDTPTHLPASGQPSSPDISVDSDTCYKFFISLQLHMLSTL
ncbi:hypothetical protein HELRODRAFT_170118 [Helobdella robusta]|uniref:Endonuclease/exonuclease/phosphatase domain-containing protein n=1 Tax=Helobdella robusta TaxID=6412 RepID=T1F2N7_HELRO|nr:hypothetical protein HELRODRAFT_170118 [Helobdella robusta]ESO07572.1 hypothetical protein HELRODRAFT_170118 [Helobdella robusta]